MLRDTARLTLQLDVDSMKLEINTALCQRHGELQDLLAAEVDAQMRRLPQLVAETVEHAFKIVLQDALRMQSHRLSTAITDALRQLVIDAIQKGR